MALILRLLPDNPVLTKELRVRMRGARAYWILLGYLGFLSLVMLTQYWAWIINVRQNGGGSQLVRLQASSRPRHGASAAYRLPARARLARPDAPESPYA